MSGKREQYLSWDGYFMSIALNSSLRSKDPSTRHGACIVNADNKIIASGYNGFPKWCSDEEFPWERDGNPNDIKTPYVVHSELNAILNSSSSVKGSRLYLYSEKGYLPCSECAKAIIQSGISEIIIATIITNNTDLFNWVPTRRMFKSAGIKLRLMDFDVFIRDMSFVSSEINKIIDQTNIYIKEGKVKRNFES